MIQFLAANGQTWKAKLQLTYKSIELRRFRFPSSCFLSNFNFQPMMPVKIVITLPKGLTQEKKKKKANNQSTTNYLLVFS